MSYLSRLNAYRIMWIFVIFDLPTTEKKDRRNYRKFVDNLEADGFIRLQYSVYMRHCSSREDATVHRNRIKRVLPPAGEIVLMHLTDKQFGMMEFFVGKKTSTAPESGKQLTIFD
ncbi:MAG: CRISPR-associated endonuclease Cas2 [Chitinophagales bacterium]|nr:CRISPR-associated endonuclease Cas2 [Bacteroidota bacterium]